MSLETLHLTLVPCAAEHLLAVIEQPERFEQVAGLRAAEGLRGFFVSDEVSPDWLAALREASGSDPWRHGSDPEASRSAASQSGDTSSDTKNPRSPSAARRPATCSNRSGCSITASRCSAAHGTRVRWRVSSDMVMGKALGSEVQPAQVLKVAARGRQ